MFSQIAVTDITDIFTVSSPKGRYARIENRKTYGLSFCEDGQITYSLNGIQTVSDRFHAILLPQGQTYTLYGNKTGNFPVINFTCTETICETVVSIPLENPDTFLKEYERLKALSVFDGKRCEMMSIFYHILQGLSEQNHHSKIILPAIRCLEQNYADSTLTNAKLAQVCCISEVYLRRLFMQTYHVSPRQYLLDIRLSRAKQLLAEGAITVNAVALACGFTNPYHFCRIFKEKTGLTPTEYRKLNRIYEI